MKITALLFLIILVGCKKENKISNLEYPTDLNKEVNIILKLPKLKNWTNYYSNPKVKSRFDLLNTIKDSNVIRCVYLKNDTDLENFNDSTIVKNHFLVYSIDKEQKYKFDSSYLKKRFKTAIYSGIIHKDKIDNLLKTINTDKSLLTEGKPFLIDEDEFKTNSYSGVFLIKPYGYPKNYISIMILDLMIINNHLFYCGSFNEFKSLKSIEDAKKENEYIMSQFLELNEN
jgi:hypothetical protein